MCFDASEVMSPEKLSTLLPDLFCGLNEKMVKMKDYMFYVFCMAFGILCVHVH